MTDSFLKLSSSCSLSLSVSSILMLFLMPPITSMFHTQLRGPSPWTLMWTPAVLTNVRSEKREILQIIFSTMSDLIKGEDSVLLGFYHTYLLKQFGSLQILFAQASLCTTQIGPELNRSPWKRT